jgi:hypothetical protein
MSARADKLAQELREAFANRALIYAETYAELRGELGEKAAAALMGRALYRRGQDVARKLFVGIAPGDAAAVAERFLSVSPDGGCLFPTQVERLDDGSVHINVQSCPLLSAWQQAGVPPAEIAQLCAIAGRFDNGLFESADIEFSAETWTPGRSGCCHLHLRPRP